MANWIRAVTAAVTCMAVMVALMLIGSATSGTAGPRLAPPPAPLAHQHLNVVPAQAVPEGELQRRPGRPPAPPSGFRYAFGDGRLNPDRGKGTARGAAQMTQFWTETVPRQLLPGAELRASPVERRFFGNQ